MRKTYLVFLLCLAFCVPGRGEIAVPAEPVGNATDRAVPEKPTRHSKKRRELSAVEKAHRMAHRHPKKKTKTARKGGLAPAQEEKL